MEGQDVINNANPSEGQQKQKKTQRAEPGKHVISQKVTMSQSAGEMGTFIFDEEPIQIMSNTLAARVHPSEERLNNDPQLFDDFKLRTKRMVYMMLAKKLTASLSPDQSAQYGGYLKSISNVKCFGPSALVPFIDLFGCIRTPELQFSMLGQPLLAFSFFARACVDDDQAIDFDRALFVNNHWPGWKQNLFNHFKEVLNCWAESAPLHAFNFGNGVIVRMSIPKFESNARGYNVFINAVNKPPPVRTALDVLMIIEDAVNGAQFTEQNRQALNAAQVWLLDWNSLMIAEQAQKYNLTTESRIRTAYAGCMNWVEIQTFVNVGNAGQLLHKDTPYFFSSPVMLGGDVLQSGWLAAGNVTITRMNPRMYNCLPQNTVNQAIVGWVDKMMKTNF